MLNKIILSLPVVLLAAFLLLLSLTGCQGQDAEEIACSLPYVKDVFVSGPLLYSTYVLLCGPDIVESGIQVSDKETGELYSQSDILDGWAGGLFVSGDIVYVANGVNGLVIVDSSDIDRLKVLGKIDTKGYANKVYISGDYAYIADGSAGLAVIDIIDKRDPEIVYTLQTEGYVWDVYVDEEKIYIAAGDKGIEILDKKDILEKINR